MFRFCQGIMKCCWYEVYCISPLGEQEVRIDKCNWMLAKQARGRGMLEIILSRLYWGIKESVVENIHQR